MTLRIRHLTKGYRRPLRRRPDVIANEGISLTVEDGQVLGLLGHNGAGKTTLVNQVIGLLKPDAGTIELDGRDLVADPAAARAATSLQPQSQLSLGALTPRNAIDLIGQLRGGTRERVESRRDRLIDELDIGEWRDVESENLSGGVRRLVAFAMAAIEPGRVVILDEPTNDVDPVRRRLLWQAVRRLGDEGAAVLLVTHNVAEAERAVDSITILDEGRVVSAGTPAELRQAMDGELRLELRVSSGATLPPLPAWLMSDPPEGQRLLTRLPGDRAAEAASWAEGLRRDGTIGRFALAPASLEDAYVGIVSGDPADTTEVEHVRAA